LDTRGPVGTLWKLNNRKESVVAGSSKEGQVRSEERKAERELGVGIHLNI